MKTTSKIGWGWLLVTAPSRLLSTHSPLSTGEVERRFRQQRGFVSSPKTKQFIIRLPKASTERQFFVWVESSPTGTQITGQTRTPVRTALTRMAISLVLFWLGIFWLGTAHTWLGVLFGIGCAAFLLLGQYERLTERDRKLYRDWLKQVAEAEPDRP